MGSKMTFSRVVWSLKLHQHFKKKTNDILGDDWPLDWLPSRIYREETGDHHHFGQGYMVCIRNTSDLPPKVFRMLWLDHRALVDSIAGVILSHSDNIKFQWALVLQQNKQCKRLCVDWICPSNKNFVFYSLLYVLFISCNTVALVIRVINSWDGERFPHLIYFIEGLQFYCSR